jgi:hypothetical protein
MDCYEHSLCAMMRLLEAVGENDWAAWIREDIHRWQADSDTRHHLSAYGAMGSFNDVIISRLNHHNVTEAQEPWANALFEWLKSVCYYLARHTGETVTEGGLCQAVGRYDSALAGFVGGDKAPASMRGHVSAERKLRGCRCLDCGHSEVLPSDVEYFIAQDRVPLMVFRACETKTLDDLVDRILRLDVPGLAETRQELLAAVTASGIALRTNGSWMWSCSRCGENHTAAYRWDPVSDPPMRFVPAKKNLPMRK